MRKVLSMGVLLITANQLMAKDTAPKEPPIVPVMGQVIDQTKPAYVPQFLAPAGPSQLQQTRDWAIQNTNPPCFVGMFIPIYPGCFGFVPNHGFYR